MSHPVASQHRAASAAGRSLRPLVLVASLGALALSGCGGSSGGGGGGALPILPPPATGGGPDANSSGAAGDAATALAGIDAAVAASLAGLQATGAAPTGLASTAAPRYLQAGLLPWRSAALPAPSIPDFAFDGLFAYQIDLDDDGSGTDPWPQVGGTLQVIVERQGAVTPSASGGAAQYRGTLNALTDITATDNRGRSVTWPLGTLLAWQADISWQRSGPLTGTWQALSRIERNELPIRIRDQQNRSWLGTVDLTGSATTTIGVSGLQREIARAASGARTVRWNPVVISGATGSATVAWTLEARDRVFLNIDGRGPQGGSYGGSYGPYTRAQIRSLFQTNANW